MPEKKTPTGRTANKPKTRGFRVIDWIEANCVFTNGEWAGQPFALLPWQKRLILGLFELRPDGLRRYRWAYVQVAKKNGKTELAAALALYFLIGDGEQSPLVVCAAASDEQADLVFGAAKRMCELSPTLRAVTEDGRFEKEILVPSIPGAKLKRVAAAAGTNDGQNIHAVICDELHEWVGPKGEAVWNVLTNGTGARRQPMVLQITTAGFDQETVCGRQYDYAKGVERGEITDPRYFSLIVEAPTGADHKDPAVWAASNPSWGVTVREDFFADQLTKKTESVFRRYFLDQWVPAEQIWIPDRIWRTCEGPQELDPKLPVAVGIDIGLTDDSTAVVIAQKQGDMTVIRAKFWQNPYPRGHQLRDDWRFDTEVVVAYVRELRDRFPMPALKIDGRTIPGPAFCFDPYAFREPATRLDREGFAMLEVPQNDSRMVPAARAFHDAVVNGRLRHDGDAILAAHLANVTPEERGDRGWRLTKPKGSSKKIDGAIAAVMAVFQAQAPTPPPRAKAFAA